MEENLITVIVPVYNVEKYLEKCVNSILHQTYKNLEIILVDDGSTDNSGKICDEFKEKDKRIKVIHKLNEGQSVARNIGIDLAKGKYIGFVDSDDFIQEDMYEVLYNLCKKYDSEISIVTHYEMYNNKILFTRDTGELCVLNKFDAMKELLMDKKIQNYVWNKLFKIELFDNLRFVENRYYEDSVIMPVLFERSNKVVLLEKPKYYYVRSDNSTIANINSKLYGDYLKSISDRYTYLEGKYDKLDLYNSYIFIHDMINAYSIIVTYDLDDLYLPFEELFPTFKKLMNKYNNKISDMLDDFNKAMLYMMLFDKEKSKLAIKQLYNCKYPNKVRINNLKEMNTL